MAIESELLESCKVYASQRAEIERIMKMSSRRSFTREQYHALQKLRRHALERERLLLELCASIGQELQS